MGAEWVWPASVIARVIDGDTVDAMLTRDLGFQATATFPVRLRLNRINAAPANTDKGRVCKARVLALTAGVKVTITTGKGYKYGAPDGKTGEWMAEILLPDGHNLSDELVAEQLAEHWDGHGPRPDSQ